MQRVTQPLEKWHRAVNTYWPCIQSENLWYAQTERTSCTALSIGDAICYMMNCIQNSNRQLYSFQFQSKRMANDLHAKWNECKTKPRFTENVIFLCIFLIPMDLKKEGENLKNTMLQMTEKDPGLNAGLHFK